MEGNLLIIGLTWLAKYLWAILLLVLTPMFGWAFKRLSNTYTKDEVDERLDLRVKIFEVKIENLTNTMNDLNLTLKEVNKSFEQSRIDIAVLQSNGKK